MTQAGRPQQGARVHLAPLRASQGLRRAMERAAQGFQVQVGFPGSQVEVCGLGCEAPAGRSLEEALGQEGWTALPDPVDEAEALPLGAARGALEPAQARALSQALHRARLEHLRALLHPGGAHQDTRGWVYEVLGELPGLLGVDHSMALLVPDPQQPSHYVVAAERLGQREGEEAPEHLVGLRIPCEGGRGGLLEAALRIQQQDPALPYHLFMPEDDEGSRWCAVALESDQGQSFVRFRTAARRLTEEMLILVALPISEGVFAFLALSQRSPQPLPAASVDLLLQLRRHLGPALNQSPLFQISPRRLEVLHTMACASLRPAPAWDQQAWIRQVSPALQEALGTRSLAIGLLRRDAQGAWLDFPAPQGWADSQARQVKRQCRTLVGLALRLRRSLMLTGGCAQEDPGADSPLMRWNNDLVVHEGQRRLEDARLHPEGAEAFLSQPGWERLASYYLVTTEQPVYAAVAVPLLIDGEPLGVLSLDFARGAAWESYSGFAAEALYRTLAALIASHLAPLPWDHDAS